MVIPSFMYEKHIDRHRENSESYEVEYQCLCGDVFSLIGAFRAHVQFCDKKGILPPHWGFLQKNFKIQDVTPIENCYGNEDTLTPELNSVTNITGDSQNFSKINSCRSNEHKIEDKEMLIEAGNSIKSDEKKGSLALVCHKNDVDVRNSSPKFTEIHILNNTKFDNKLIENSQKNDKDLDKIEDKCCASSTTSTNLGENNLPEIFNESSVHNEEKAVKTTKEDRNGKEVKEADVEVPKIFYDHIPCDHLGYLKTQGPEIFHKESASFEQKDASSLQNVDSQKLIMELDEKTGLMIPRKVNVNVSEEEDNSNIKENACEIDTEYFNCDDLFSKIHSNSKGKIKLGSSFFTCPFCIVLFPKHSSTFQQFRLHLEYYHTDAALNITVPSNEPCGEETNKIKTNNPTKDEKKRLSNMSFVKTQSASNIRKKSVGKKKKCPKLDSRNLETEDCLLENKQEVENTDQNEELRCKENKLYDESEKENITKEANLIVEKSNSRNNIYWTVKLSVKNNDLVEDENSELEKDNNITTCVDDECVDGSKNMRSDNAKVQETRANPANLNTVAVMQKVDCDNSKKFIFGLKNMSSGQNCDLMSEEKENGRSLRKDRADSLASLSKIEKNENFATNREKSDKIVKEVNASDFPGKKTEQTASDFDDDWENSKDSSWSNISDVELIAHQEEKIDLNYDFLARPKVVEKSRRESEVWSEFYESLQLAEKFKKSKKKELQSNGEANKKSPTLKDYSAKRIVKKPKRYRESSESECSFDENENSGSEAEFTIANQETENSKVNDQNNVQQDKRDKLLGKLKNVDQKLVDYLFDLITKKEKCLELYKKHTNFRVNRYSQDLRSYRKKILNGIKLRGRPLKLVRYQEVAKRDQAGAEKLEVFKRIGFQRSLKKNQDNKSSEKKRGRPRKILESAKLKERRRSDKEVNFIEKNFEREENGNSLSKRRRKLSSKLQYYKKINFSDEKDDFSSGQVITSKTTDSSKKFTCAVCKEVFPELNEFREHVVVHRLEENIYQCMECGECFVVRPSLEKHLHAFHKIKNTDRYITENQCCNPNREQVEPEAEILKENQCKVCKDQFERAIDLTKHFRIHGMAFLKEFKKDAKIKL